MEDAEEFLTGCTTAKTSIDIFKTHQSLGFATYVFGVISKFPI